MKDREENPDIINEFGIKQFFHKAVNKPETEIYRTA
jgi:hypothetical protein